MAARSLLIKDKTKDFIKDSRWQLVKPLVCLCLIYRDIHVNAPCQEGQATAKHFTQHPSVLTPQLTIGF